MQIAALFFIIISAATLTGNASAEFTLLHVAVASDDAEEVKRLIESGADINAKDKDGYTPLHLALNNVVIAKILIDNGADVDAENKEGWTPADLIAARVASTAESEWRFALQALGWRVAGCKTDAMTEIKTCAARSVKMRPDRSLDFPFGDMKMWLYVACQRGEARSDAAGILFSKEPVFTEGKIGDGYHRRVFYMKWDDELPPDEIWTRHTWHSSLMRIGDANIFEKIRKHNKVLVRTPPFHGEGTRDFLIHLTDASEKIDEIKRNCME